VIRRALAAVRAALSRRFLGVTAEEIRYTFDDVRKELRATRAELLAEIATVRNDVDALVGREGRHDEDEQAVDDEKPVAEA
jgi:hypothetical protein